MKPLDERDIALIRVLQREDTFLREDPYEWTANVLGWDVGEVIERTRAMKAAGVIRRFGAAVTPVNAGFTSNAMIVWMCAQADEERAGRAMAAHKSISHCYVRRTFPGFDYSLYTMVHAANPEELDRIIRELKQASGLEEYRSFTTVKEYKKSSPVYFPGTQSAGTQNTGANETSTKKPGPLKTGARA